jgi:GNAT superfamily N-acetyltransferase
MDMAATLRAFDPNLDMLTRAELLQTVSSEPVTVDVLADREAKWPPDGVRCRLVCETDGDVVGYASAHHWPYQPDGRFDIAVVVRPASRRRGHGTLLTAEVERFAREHGATTLHATIRETEPDGLRFAVARGYRVERTEFESVLDVASFNAATLAGFVESVKAAGFRFFSFADTNQDAVARRRLFALNTETARDVPGSSPHGMRPPEQFEADIFGSHWFRPAGQLIAADGGRWIGLAAVGEVAPGIMVNMHTGVLRDYRGRGIATALKLLAIEFCRRCGATTLRTNNDSTNAPILAINRKLGYYPVPGRCIMARDIRAKTT